MPGLLFRSNIPQHSAGVPLKVCRDKHRLSARSLRGES